MEVTILNESSFEETTKEGLVLVDFWAEWCGPCQQMAPVLSDFAKQMDSKMKVWKVNVDDNPDLAQKFRVMSIPTLVLLKDWEMVDQMIWVQDIDKLKETCEKYL